MAEQFNEIGRKLLSPVYDPRADRQPTTDEAVDDEMLAEEKEMEVVPAAVRVQPKNTELAALEQTVQKAAKQGRLL